MGKLDLTRRSLLKAGGMGGLGAIGLSLAGSPWSKALAASGSVTLADIGVGDPAGDWSRYSNKTDWDVNLVAVGNAPATIINVLLGGGGTSTYDALHIVGGVQEPLAQLGLILPVDPSRMPNWGANEYIAQYFENDGPGWPHIAHEGQVYGIPTILQGESICYLPDETGGVGSVDSFGALFDPQYAGYVALEDNYTTAGYKTAIHMKHAGIADIGNPVDMTKDEINTVVDYLIEKKKAGQFRVLWTSFEQAVNLLLNKEVVVLDGWEPMVIVANKQGANSIYATPKEGYLLWAMSGYITNNPARSEEHTQAVYDLFDFMLGPWYGAKISAMRGYMTNSQAPGFAAANPDAFAEGEAEAAVANDANVKRKLEFGGIWHNRWPASYIEHEAAWARFKAA